MKQYRHYSFARLNNLIIFIFLGFFFITSCSTVRNQPFSDFTASLQELRKGADKALKYNDTAGRNRFIEEAAEASTTTDGEEVITNLLIEGIEGNPFAWKMNKVPLFMVSPQFRSGVYNLNSTLVAYSELLASLADSDLVSRTEFDALAKDLNGNLKAAAAKLELKGLDKRSGFFSLAASQAAYAYIDNKRRKKLLEMLEKNQPLIIDISTQLQAAVRNAVRNLRQDYEQQSIMLARQLVPDLSVKLNDRKKTLRALVELNEEYLMRLSILESLSNSYRSLPGAHNELIKAVETPGFNLAAIKGLYENGKHLYELYKETQEGR